jgi:gluconokinase
MNVPNLRSPYDTVGGIVYIARMFDKIRLNAAGQLPADYTANLGGGFDARACQFLHIDYPALVTRVKQGSTDDEILQWCFTQGQKPSEAEIEIWSEFLKKRGWNDSGSERLAQVAQKLPPQWHGKIHTFFDLIEADEGRTPRCR